MNKNHIIVIKAGDLGIMSFRNLHNIKTLMINGNEAEINNGSFSLNYWIDEIVDFCFN